MRADRIRLLRILEESAGRPLLASEALLVIILGDGWYCRTAAWLCNHTSGATIVSIDPVYTPQFRSRFKRLPACVRKALRGAKAEDVKLEPLLRKHKPRDILLVAFQAHTDAGKFWGRLKKAGQKVAPKARLYAAIEPCCRPGLNKRQTRDDYISAQLAYPEAPPAKRPLHQKRMRSVKDLLRRREQARARREAQKALLRRSRCKRPVGRRTAAAPTVPPRRPTGAKSAKRSTKTPRTGTKTGTKRGKKE